MNKIIATLSILLCLNCNAQNYTNVNSDDFKVNGILNISTTKDSLKKAFPKMKVVKIEQDHCMYNSEEYYKTKFYNYSKNGIRFLVYDKEAYLQEINFKENPETFLMYKGFKINKNTSVKELQKYFPKSYKYFIKEKDTIFRLRWGEEFDGEFQFEIKNNKVVNVNDWMPC